jgi:pimeloyl-ACP methyl ester carboxylesterase
LYPFIGAICCGCASYRTVCIPSKGNANALPIIYFFDPHGSGALPLNKYRSLAETYGFILAGSNNSKNGNDWSLTERIWQQLAADTKARLKIDGSRIYTCGFSGGAKVAGYVAIQHPDIKGVIAGGAGLPDGVQADNFNFSFTAIAGEGDMNLTELVAINRDLDKTRTRHHILFFDGKHEWAPVGTMETAFSGLQIDAMQKALIRKDNTFIDHFAGQGKNRVGAYSQSSHLIKAEQECQVFISYLDGLTPAVDWFKTKAASLAGDRVYRQQRDALQTLLVYEQNTKLGYMQHFQQGDPHYWGPVINDLQTKSKSTTASGLVDQRLLAYLSLAFYSLSNRLIISNNNTDARRFVELYKMADPTNSEAWYFSALLSARAGQVRAAENDLLKAAECGFTDMNRLRQQPEFQSLDLSGVGRKMHGR